MAAAAAMAMTGGSSPGGRPAHRYWDDVYAGRDDPVDLRDVPLETGFGEVIGDVDGLRVLDLGSGDGHLSVWLATRGASVVAVDRAAGAVDATRRNASASGVGDGIDARHLDALDVDELGELFDLVVGRFVLHHMEPFGEFVDALGAVVAPGARGVFYENSAANPVLNFARRHIAGRFGVPRFGDDDEQPFDTARIEECRRRFEVTTHHPRMVFFGLANVYLVRGRSRRLSRLNRTLDRFLGAVPAVRRLSYHQIVELRSPRAAPTGSPGGDSR